MLDSLARKVNRLEPEGKKYIYFFYSNCAENSAGKVWLAMQTHTWIRGQHLGILAEWGYLHKLLLYLANSSSNASLLVVPLLHIIKQTLITSNAQVADRSLEEKKKRIYVSKGLTNTFFFSFSYPLGKKVPFGDKALKGSLGAERQPLPFSMSASKLGWWFQRAAVGKCLKMFKFSNTKPCQNMFSSLAGVWWKIHQGKQMGGKKV